MPKAFVIRAAEQLDIKDTELRLFSSRSKESGGGGGGRPQGEIQQAV